MNGEKMFEGEYKGDRRWNCKGYDEMNNYCLELKEGKGLAKIYNKNGKLNFEGEYSYGERNGKGKEYFQMVN